MRFYFKSEIHIKSNPLVCVGTSIKDPLAAIALVQEPFQQQKKRRKKFATPDGANQLSPRELCAVCVCGTRRVTLANGYFHSIPIHQPSGAS
jgi:hypothetical protein